MDKYVKQILAPERKRIVLVAHDNKKKDLVEWAKFNKKLLSNYELSATGTTGKILSEVLGIPINCFRSGPLGGDQQIGAKITEGEIDMVIFFWDPLEPQPHDVDVKALLRIAVVYNVPIACNRASADFMISSPLMNTSYSRIVEDYDKKQGERIGSFKESLS
ncbi:MAG: methylglyoxal synthase [Nitrospirae bacterium]|nr:methylglyoxal synthase [Nitrospirota bacterium]